MTACADACGAFLRPGPAEDDPLQFSLVLWFAACADACLPKCALTNYRPLSRCNTAVVCAALTPQGWCSMQILSAISTWMAVVDVPLTFSSAFTAGIMLSVLPRRDD